jgi:hypothetical protein
MQAQTTSAIDSQTTFRRVVRYFFALLLLMYGFAKINGAQFTTLDSDLDKPLGHVSADVLTWYYFGYSLAYKAFVSLLELGGALLLTFDRTAFLGACILAPVLVNIVLIDIFYGIHPSGTITAIVLLIAMLYLIAPRRKDLIAFFLPPSAGARRHSAWLTRGKWAARAAMIAVPFSATYWIAHYNNRFPIPIYGAWDVVQVEPMSAASQLPVTLFFEFNGAFLAVFKSSSGDYSQHDFQVDPTHHIRMWENWLKKGDIVFDGVYAVSGSQLTLRGKWRGAGDLALKLSARKIRH